MTSLSGRLSDCLLSNVRKMLVLSNKLYILLFINIALFPIENKVHIIYRFFTETIKKNNK